MVTLFLDDDFFLLWTYIDCFRISYRPSKALPPSRGLIIHGAQMTDKPLGDIKLDSSYFATLSDTKSKKTFMDYGSQTH